MTGSFNSHREANDFWAAVVGMPPVAANEDQRRPREPIPSTPPEKLMATFQASLELENKKDGK